jgi:amidohydrolase
MPRLIENKVKRISSEYRLKYKFTYEVLGRALKNSGSILKICGNSAKELLGASKVKMVKKPSMGGEDFAEYLRYVPGCFVYVGVKGKDKTYAWHHDKFDIDEKALDAGARFLAKTATDYLAIPTPGIGMASRGKKQEVKICWQ